jgi:hypothetical protein
MQVQVNTGNGLAGKETLENWTTEFLNDALARFRGELTRVEVQLADEARGKQGPNDMHCMLEARLTGHAPIAVNHNAQNMDQAIRGAAQKLIHALDHAYGKLDRHEHRTRESIRTDPEAIEPAPNDVTTR